MSVWLSLPLVPTAFYDNGYGFFALKVNKFIELEILEAIRSDSGEGEFAGVDSAPNGRDLLDSLISLKAFITLSFLHPSENE